ncbi:winged helix-turn-helix transcriptional regulator [Mucilaginibacter lappiensis]|uniref:DNA-binding HxlR family transcriptional regulator n=1 Tax=Mucilaginibacter lappiensis TaxID=354630 RepID=A0A1N7F4Y1_9SPHI|nr:helix-turn-helix domain-containing protein [Mucilaginibacter lappiensis]MBB6112054.1 DNA-binding HxlR family transcriptional regulator [Mucilaginibacter lappiensis]MBB6127949.1 DNA-binding HxlR family transcriptional regulator [Mucilaginibacter lappiensis]SIR95398.1 transcriptional regulator, HxlR family [Mucilaginibacter lappiensis]
MEGQFKKRDHGSEACKAAGGAVRDALYVLNGKWKLPLIATLSDGPLRFNDIQRALGDITPKILSKELKELELNEFVKRNVFSTTPVTVTYELTSYSQTLEPVLEELKKWGTQHRERIIANRRQSADVELTTQE